MNYIELSLLLAPSFLHACCCCSEATKLRPALSVMRPSANPNNAASSYVNILPADDKPPAAIGLGLQEANPVVHFVHSPATTALQTKVVNEQLLPLQTRDNSSSQNLDDDEEDEMSEDGFKNLFLRAINSEEAVLRVLKKTPDPTYYFLDMDIFRHTALHFLCVFGYAEAIKTVIEQVGHGCDVLRVHNHMSETPFGISSFYKHKSLAHLRIFCYLHNLDIEVTSDEMNRYYSPWALQEEENSHPSTITTARGSSFQPPHVPQANFGEDSDEMSEDEFKTTFLRVLNSEEAVLSVLTKISDPTYYFMEMDIFRHTVLHYICTLGYEQVLEAVIKKTDIPLSSFRAPNHVGKTPLNILSVYKGNGVHYREIMTRLGQEF